jgi:hypothetical protein
MHCFEVECKPSGREGYVFYREGANELPFYWEYGGGDFVVIVRIEEPDKFVLRYSWAAERKGEILKRVAQEIIRQQAPGCNAEIDERHLCILVREQSK